MTSEQLEREIRRACPGLTLLTDEPMKDHCSFRIGGPADIFAEPGCEEELERLVALLRGLGEEPVVIGNGTNILVRDEGVRGVVIKAGEKLGGISAAEGGIYVGCGAGLTRVAAEAQRRGLAGLEFAFGIPGSVGGAVLMNAGAYGGEIKDVAARVKYLDAGGETAECSDCGFGYRHSRFSDGGYVILGAFLRLSPGDPAVIQERMRELMTRRTASQPLEMPSAGSTFKRPKNGYAAAMIEGAGLKGFRIGGAQVSEKHAGFVVNAGGATFADVETLMDHIRNEVYRRYGTELEPEVKIIG